jgi:hypothetical protein
MVREDPELRVNPPLWGVRRREPEKETLQRAFVHAVENPQPK